MDCAIQFDNVTASYGSKTALREITLGVPAKQIFGIIGPANSGKTTLLKCINRTLEFTPSAASAARSWWPGGMLPASATCMNCAAAWAWSFRCR